MSHVLVTFKFRFEKTSIELEIKTPTDLCGLIDILVNKYFHYQLHYYVLFYDNFSIYITYAYGFHFYSI